MKRLAVCFLIPMLHVTISIATIFAAFSPHARASEDSQGTEKVIVYGCDGSSWESSSGVARGQADVRGTWIGQEMSGGGQWSIIFTEYETFKMKGPGDEWHDGKYACDSNQDPKQMNLYIKQSSNPAYIGQTSLVIYKTDASTMTCAVSDPGAKNRPGSFTPDSGTRVLVVNKQQ